MFAGIVADNTNLPTDTSTVRNQQQLGRLDVVQVGRIVTVKPEVVHRIAIHRRQSYFFVIAKDSLGDDRSRGYDMPVGQDKAAFRVDNEACCLA